MNIQSEIRDYINSHDFVMLPGIGGFLAEYSKPYYDSQGNIVPSERKIRFNPDIRNDSDVEILQVFRERLQISNEEVQDFYFQFLENLDSTLASTGRYYWEGLGILIKDSPRGVLQFISTQTSETVTEADVLPSKDAYSLSQNPLPESEEIQEDQPYIYKKKRSGGVSSILIFALPLALLAGALIYMVFFKPSIENKVQNQSVSEVFPDDYVGEKVEIDTLLNEPTPTPFIKEEPIKERIVGIGIYKNEKDADKIATFLAEEGYPSRVRPYGSLYKVYLVAVSDTQALQYVQEVEQLIGDKPVYER